MMKGEVMQTVTCFRRALFGVVVAGAMGTVIGVPLAQAAPGESSDPFGTCMAQNGVSAPQGGPGGPGAPSGPPPSGTPQGGPQGGPAGTPPAPPGVDKGFWDKAIAACQSLAPVPPAR